MGEIFGSNGARRRAGEVLTLREYLERIRKQGKTRMRRLARVILVVFLVVPAWLAFVLCVPYQGFPRKGLFVDVPRGASAGVVARLLAEKGVVRSRLAFEALCRWRPRCTLQAGQYFFDQPATAFEVYRAIAEGRVYQAQVTVPEGLTMFDIADLLAQQGLVSRRAFLQAAGDPMPIRDLAPGARTLEGFLFPGKYAFSRHTTPQEIVEAMVQRFRETWRELPGVNRDELSAQAVATLASLVVRETSVPEEQPLVAAVFTNRLRRGLALQCDATVIYALERAKKYSGSLTFSDLRFDSPYNTYRHTGLPPAPIANPGEAALRAALNPSLVDYLYFVASGRGGHLFSRTFQEHNRNVARYRRLLAQNADGDTLERKSNAKRSP